MNKNIVFFDGQCNLCNFIFRTLIKADRNEILYFAKLQSEKGRNILNKYGYNSDSLNTIILLKNNQLFCESEAVFEILKILGGFYKMFSIFRVLPLSMRDKTYRLIARNRYKLFGTKNDCMIPDKNTKKRFID